MSKSRKLIAILLFVVISLCSSAQLIAVTKLVEASNDQEYSPLGVIQISLTTRDLIFDPVSGKIYASIPSTAGSLGNSVVSIGVPDGSLGTPISVGGNPNKLAVSDDGQYLYVGLDGAAAVRRVDLKTKTAGIQFTLGSSFCGPFFAEDMVVLKGNANAVAVSRRNSGCSPRHEGVAIYDDGVQRPDATPWHTGSNVIEPSDSASVLYGYNNETSEFGFRVMEVITTGVVVSSTTGGLIDRYYADIRYGDGLVYATTGAVIDPQALTSAGAFGSSGLVAIDAAAGRVDFLHSENYGKTELLIFDQASRELIAQEEIPGVTGTPGSLINVGRNLLAFRTEDGQVFILTLKEHYATAFLPLVNRPLPGISGQVTLNGAPINGVPLSLRIYDGSSWYNASITTTNQEGIYQFVNQLGLGPGQMYYVLYQNQYQTPGRLWLWGTRLLTTYNTGDRANLGSFDIADIVLETPGAGAVVSLPQTFQWTPRPATRSDNYEFDLYDPSDYDPYFYTDPPLGYVGSYTLSGLPAGFKSGKQYGWEIWVYDPDGGYGISYEARGVSFGGAGLAGPGPQLETLERRLLRQALPDWDVSNR